MPATDPATPTGQGPKPSPETSQDVRYPRFQRTPDTISFRDFKQKLQDQRHPRYTKDGEFTAPDATKKSEVGLCKHPKPQTSPGVEVVYPRYQHTEVRVAEKQDTRDSHEQQKHVSSQRYDRSSGMKSFHEKSDPGDVEVNQFARYQGNSRQTDEALMKPKPEIDTKPKEVYTPEVIPRYKRRESDEALRSKHPEKSPQTWASEEAPSKHFPRYQRKPARACPPEEDAQRFPRYGHAARSHDFSSSTSDFDPITHYARGTGGSNGEAAHPRFRRPSSASSDDSYSVYGSPAAPPERSQHARGSGLRHLGEGFQRPSTPASPAPAAAASPLTPGSVDSTDKRYARFSRGDGGPDLQCNLIQRKVTYDRTFS